jgi:glyoxylase I family protein
MLKNIHHIAIICSDYNKSKSFYIDTLGLTEIRETYREERDSYKLDLAINGTYCLELFSFPYPPPRSSRPEATGLRHLAFEVDLIEKVVDHLATHNVVCEPIRIDEITGKRFTFFSDPDGLPLELYEL